MSLPPLIPRSVLFGVPTRTAPKLAPSGERIAYLAPHAGAPNIWVGTPGGAQDRPVTADARGIIAFEWAFDERYLLFVQDNHGDENTHLFAVDRASGQIRDLTPFDGVRAKIIGRSARVPGTLLVGMNRRDPRLFDVYRADLAGGTLELAEENPGLIGFVADPGLRLAAALAPCREGGAKIMVRDDTGGWRPLLRVGHQDFGSFSLAGVTAAGELVVLSPTGAQAARLLLVDPGTARSQVIFEDRDGFDVVGADTDPVTGRPRLAIVERDRAELEVLDPALAGDIARLRCACRGEPRLLGRDGADRRWLVLDNTDDRPPSYLLFDRPTGELTFLFHHLPELTGSTLAPMEPFSFAARDGLTIHGYATYPPGRPRRGLPTVVEIHGGPWARDRWGFRALPQWLANRGYLCVQVNYRGSTGFGRDFLAAGDREWGRAMLHDVIDAVRFLTDRGACDPRRVAAYGASYGGYAALCAAAFEPGAFSCAICFAAPTDLRSFIASVPGTWNPTIAELHARVGDPATDADFLWSRSPMSAAEKISIPLLIGHGANDPRVRQAEAGQLVAELRVRGVPHEYLSFPDEGHNLSRAENRLAFYAAAERFLAKYLGGRCEAPSAAELGAIATLLQ